MPWPVLGWIYASKLLEGTLGKFIATAAGIEGSDALPVARQSPPQNGRSLAAKEVSMVFFIETSRSDSQPVMTRTGPAYAFAMAKPPCVNSSPTVTGCLVTSE